MSSRTGSDKNSDEGHSDGDKPNGGFGKTVAIAVVSTIVGVAIYEKEKGKNSFQSSSKELEERKTHLNVDSQVDISNYNHPEADI